MADRRDVDGPVAFLRALSTAGIDDTLVLRSETASSVLTEKRMELVEAIASGDVESVRDLSRRLDRDVSIVSRDLDVLFEAGVIAFEEVGRAKRPVLAHQNVLVRPIVFDGEVLQETQETGDRDRVGSGERSLLELAGILTDEEADELEAALEERPDSFS